MHTNTIWQQALISCWQMSGGQSSKLEAEFRCQSSNEGLIHVSRGWQRMNAPRRGVPFELNSSECSQQHVDVWVKSYQGSAHLHQGSTHLYQDSTHLHQDSTYRLFHKGVTSFVQWKTRRLIGSMSNILKWVWAEQIQNQNQINRPRKTTASLSLNLSLNQSLSPSTYKALLPTVSVGPPTGSSPPILALKAMPTPQ